MLHGHNLRSQGMFGTLDSFSDFTYVKQYPIITFRTIYDAEPVNYVIISAFHASMQPGETNYFDVMEIAFDTEEAHRAYIDKVLARSLWQGPADVNT